MKQDATILVCCHKDDYFYDGDNYLPIQVGKDISSIDLGIQGDNVGDNISVKNRSYCELTAMYWAWKNLRNIGYIGLNHYRRYFNFYEKGTIGKEYTIVSINEIQNKRLSIDNIDQLFSGADVILSKQKSYPYSLEIDYSICHLSKDIKILREVISELSPEYIVPFDKYVRYGNKLSHYNMFHTECQVVIKDFRECFRSLLLRPRSRYFSALFS